MSPSHPSRTALSPLLTKCSSVQTEQDEPADVSNKIEMAEMIRCIDVSRTYEADVPVQALRPTTLSIEDREFFSIEGPSGSGKSTLMNLLGLLDVPTGGKYYIEGVDTSELTERDRTALRAQHFGFVFQSFHLLQDRTVEENVGLGLLYQGVPKSERKCRALEMLDRVGMSHRRDSFPRTLSGGEKQRVAIARALVAA